MARFLHLASSSALRKIAVVFLALSWCLGLCLGGFFNQNCGASIISLMNMAVSSHVSIVGTLIPFLLPFLFSAAAVYLCIPWLNVAVCFCKAFLFSFVTCGLFVLYGSAAWLVQLLFMFSDICFCALLFLYWLRHVTATQPFSIREASCFLTAAIAIAGAEYWFIFPFLQGVLLI